MWRRCARVLPRHVHWAPPAAAALGLIAAGGSGGNLRGSPRAMMCQTQAPGGASAISVGCYNVLCSTYAVKWGEREGVAPDGSSNWAQRWPVMRSVIERARWDVVCLQEVEQTDVEEIVAGLGPEYTAYYFKHEVRPPDGVMIAVRSQAFDGIVPREAQFKGAAFGRVDLVHKGSGRRVRVLTAHCRGGNQKQLEALGDFADEGGQDPDVTVITGDFNEDFHTPDRGQVNCPFPDFHGRYETLLRESGLPELSRPPHKQAEDQSSGKGKIDFIFVRGWSGLCAVELFRDPASRVAILSSHSPCSATGQWPSDHGAEALSFKLLPPDVGEGKL